MGARVESTEGVTIVILVTTSIPKIKAFESKYLGRLFTPRMKTSVGLTVDAGLVWGADNDCYSGFNETNYRKMLANVRGHAGCVFVTAPDVVGDARATLERFGDWEREIHDVVGQPIGLVAQDGLTPCDVPWDSIEALFIGGTTEWKLGDEARHLASIAKSKGRWVHMGRVNTPSRLEYAYRLGCDSVDGSSFGRFPSAKIPRALEVMDELHRSA